EALFADDERAVLNVGRYLGEVRALHRPARAQRHAVRERPAQLYFDALIHRVAGVHREAERTRRAGAIERAQRDGIATARTARRRRQERRRRRAEIHAVRVDRHVGTLRPLREDVLDADGVLGRAVRLQVRVTDLDVAAD